MENFDTSLILGPIPNYAYGRRKGYTDKETEDLAQEIYSEMENTLTENSPIPIEYDVEMTSYGTEYNKPICPKCNQRNLYRKQRFCDKCGCGILW